MKEDNQNLIQLFDKFIYFKESFNGWSIVIMPDKILIDNFHHGYIHLHPERLEIKTKTLNDSFLIIWEHINKYEGVKLEQLKKDLIK